MHYNVFRPPNWSIKDMADTQKATSYAKKSSDGRLEGIEQRDRHGRVIYVQHLKINFILSVSLSVCLNVYIATTFYSLPGHLRSRKKIPHENNHFSL